MENKSGDIDRSKKIEDSLERLIKITGGVQDSVNKIGESSEKLVFLIKGLNSNTKRHNKILIGLSFMLLALTLIEVAQSSKFYDASLIGASFFVFWFIGGALVVIEGVVWFFEFLRHNRPKT